MHNSIIQVYKEINEKVTVDNLKKISIDIIASYKNKKYQRLKKYASILRADTHANVSKLFLLLIKQYHPDKRSSILKLADELYKTDDYENIKRLHSKYFFTIETEESVSEMDIGFEEEYRFDKSEFGYRKKNIFDDDTFGETNLEFDETETDFIDAVNKMFFGGLDYTITKSDLKNLDGELDLSDYDISDLNGIEYCIYVHELNLSNNRIDKTGQLSHLIHLQSLYLSNNVIENIEPLVSLIRLRELDISFNNIMDISVLTGLEELEYVNIIGNPIQDYSIIHSLIDKGVIVIFEHTNMLF